MKEVYVIICNEYREEGRDENLISIHETLRGAIERFHEVVFNEKADYVYRQTGSTEMDKETLELHNIKEQSHEDPDGTLDWHIWLPSGWDEVFVHIFRYPLYS